MGNTNLFTIAQQQFDEAAELLGLDFGMRGFLRWHQEETVDTVRALGVWMA